MNDQASVSCNVNSRDVEPSRVGLRDVREVSLSALRQIDGCCERFEQSLRGGQPTEIEACLRENAENPGRLFREILAIELEFRARRSDFFEPAEYIRRFPQFAETIANVFAEATSRPPRAVEPELSAPLFLANHARYRVLRLLGMGGMGTVYLAKHLALDREVALKVIRTELLARSEVVERFRSEAKAAASLNHPNIVAVFDAETAADRHFLVMEYITGADLFHRVQEHGPMTIESACDLIRQAAFGLQHAHQQGMVHRDISPRNLMLAADGQIKVLDFGLAESLQQRASGDRASEKEMLLGSVDFMAPEQAVDFRTADIRADIYSLGCTLWFLLVGKPPFPAATTAEKLRRHAEAEPSRLDAMRRDAPAKLADTVDRMLRKRPADRFATPGEVAVALAEFCAIPKSPLMRRRRVIGAGAGLAVLALAALAFVAIVGRLGPFRDTTLPPATAFSSGLPTADPSAAQESDESPDAKRLYREGRHLLSERKEQQVHAAIGRLEQAVELAPHFALAQTALADAYNLCGDYGWDFPDEVFPKARQAAQRALSQNEQLAEAHLAMAFVLHAYDCNWPIAETEYRRALALNPRLPAAHHWYAWFLAERGRPEEAANEIRTAHELAPDDLIIVNNVGKLMYLAHDFAGAAARHRYALELDPDFRKAHRDLGLADAELGQLKEALEQFEQSRGLTGDGRDVLGAKAYALARNGHAVEARTVLAKLEPLSSAKPVVYDIAAVYAALGEPDPAFQWLDRAVALHISARSGLRVDPRFESLRTDPRWEPTLQRIGPEPKKSS